MPTHKCPPKSCSKQVGPDMLMCLKHWRMVPEGLKRTIWRTWRNGPVREHQKACREATEAVDRAEAATAPRIPQMDLLAGGA